MYRKFMFLAAGIMSAICMASCEKPGADNEAPADDYYLELADEADALLEFTPDFQGSYELKLNTNIPKKHLQVTYVDDQDWCSADLDQSGTAILIMPASAHNKDLQAEFRVETKGLKQNVAPLTFTVKRLYQYVEHSLKVTAGDRILEGDYPIVEVSGSAQTVTFTVQTNASLWKMGYDYFSDDAEWFTIDKVSGRSGEALTLSLTKNESGDARSQSFTFTPSFAGTDVAVNVTVVQNAWSSIEKVVLKHFNATTMTAGEVINEGYVVSMPCGATARSPFCFSVDVVGEGGFDVKFASPDSKELDYSDWAFFGRKPIEDAEYNTIGYYYTLTTASNAPSADGTVTGQERAADVVIVQSGTTIELFRFRIVQAAWTE